MSPWQRRARLLIAVGGIAFAIVVATAFRTRAPQVSTIAVERSDPTALVESAGGRTIRINRDKEEIRIEYEKTLTYADGSNRLEGVTVVTERGGGRVFTIVGEKGHVGEKEAVITLEGNVKLTGSDGMAVKTERAVFTQDDGIVRVPGPVDFVRGHMTGSGVGLIYDKNQDIMVVLDQVVIQMEAGEGRSGLQIHAGMAEFKRRENVVRFERSLKVVRESKTIDADAGIAHLTADGARLDLFEMRGNARITETSAPAGGLETMTATNMDLKYGADGETLRNALLTGGSLIQVAGPPGEFSRRISAMTIDAVLGPDGATPTALKASPGVEVLIPGGPGGSIRTINAQTLAASGEPPRGLQNARFTGNVQFRERGPDGGRAARSAVLDLSLTPGFGAMEEARFSGAVRFEENNMASDSATARYVLTKGTLELGGRESGHERPHLVHGRIGIYGDAIDVELVGPKVNATGDVKSVLQPAAHETDGAAAGDVKMPSLLKRDQVVNVTASKLEYDGRISKALYSGSALLWQGETSIKAATITIEDRSGDMSASGKVATSVVLAQATGPAGQTERARSTTTADDFLYEEEPRRATYTGNAHMNSIEGDMTGSKIELYLMPGGDELERAEAYDNVTLREKSRKTTGTRMTYFGQEQRYLVSGAPVLIIDECGRETTGRTLTFYRTTDRILVDGSEQIRTQTKGGSKCPGS